MLLERILQILYLFTIIKIRHYSCQCTLSPLLHPLELLSRRPNSTGLARRHIDSLYQQYVGQLPGLSQWNGVINNVHLQENHTQREKDVLETYIDAFAQLMDFIMTEKVERDLIVITDLDPSHTFLRGFQHKMLMNNYHLDIEHLTADQLRQTDDAVRQIVTNKFRVVLLLLPWEIGEEVMTSADRNFLVNSGHAITWLSFNIGWKMKAWPCVHEISIEMLLEVTYYDSHDCELKVSTLQVRNIGNRMIETMSDCDLDIPTLNITTIIDQPFVTLARMDVDIFGGNICLNSHPCSIPRTTNGTTVWIPSCCAGLVIDILMVMKKSLKFKAQIYGCPDRQYGSIVNGTWSGMVNEVLTQRADMAVQGLTANAVRSVVVDFTSPFMLTSIGIVRKRKALELPVINWEFLKMLKLDLVLGLVSSFAVVFIFLFTYENINHYVHSEGYYPTREAFSYIAGLTFQRDLAGKTPHKWSARFVAIIYAIAMTIVMTSYTANLTASNLTETSDDKFQGLKDPKIVNPTPAFVYGVRRGTSTVLYFKENIQPRLSRAYNTFIKYYLTKTNYEGLQKVNNGEYGAFIGDYSYLLYQVVMPEFCSRLSIHKENGLDFPLAFAVQKNSKWKHVISEKMREMEEDGSLQEIRNKWFFLPQCYFNLAQANEFPWEYIGGMLLAVGVFVLVSIVIVFMETCYTRKQAKTSIFHGMFSMPLPAQPSHVVVINRGES